MTVIWTGNTHSHSEKRMHYISSKIHWMFGICLCLLLSLSIAPHAQYLNWKMPQHSFIVQMCYDKKKPYKVDKTTVGLIRKNGRPVSLKAFCACPVRPRSIFLILNYGPFSLINRFCVCLCLRLNRWTESLCMRFYTQVTNLWHWINRHNNKSVIFIKTYLILLTKISADGKVCFRLANKQNQTRKKILRKVRKKNSNG